MKVYLVRHAQSEDGALGFHQRPESPLNEQGMREAQSIAERIKEVNPELIFTSPYVRAKQTAEIIAKETNLKAQENDLLRELKRPTEIEGKAVNNVEVLRIKSEIVKRFLEDGQRFSDEETFVEFKERITELMTFLENTKAKSVILVSHCNVARMIFALSAYGTKLTPEIFLGIYKTIFLPTVGLTIYEQNSSGRWLMETWNCQFNI